MTIAFLSQGLLLEKELFHDKLNLCDSSASAPRKQGSLKESQTCNKTLPFPIGHGQHPYIPHSFFMKRS